MQPRHPTIVKSSGILCITGVLALVVSVTVARAAVTITGNYVGATAPTLNSTYGTLELALNMGGDPLTRDGIAFTTAGTSSVGSTRTFLSNGGVGATIDVLGTTIGGAAWGTTPLGTLDSLFHTVAYANDSTGYTIDLTDLDASKSYQLQFLFGDPRTAFPHSRTVTLSDNLLSSDTAVVNYGAIAVGDEFAMLTAVVSGSTSYKFTSPHLGATGNGAPIISGLVVQSIPEPSAALLSGLGLLALLRRRRA